MTLPAFDWSQLLGSLGMPIALALIALFVVWDRRRTRRAILPERPDPWREGRTDSPAPAPEEPPRPYTVYTREFDLELDASDIPARLSGASRDRPKWTDRHGVGWAAALGLVAQRALNERPVDEVAAELCERIGDTPGDLAVTLLLDQSGSMRGEPIAATAAALAQVECALTRLGVTTEVLGFSTAGWHGGHARAKWIEHGRPAHPGRLCALLHIVYKTAADPEWSRESREAMLHPDLLRENIDGEALDWAAARLALLPHPRKLLIILSDGAAVDDSTLRENASDYLERDLLRAIAAIEARSGMILGAIGIGHAVERYYRHSRENRIGSIADDLTLLIGELASGDASAPRS